MTMKEKDFVEIFSKTGTVLEGHFLLSSGLHSERYLQCALVLQHPEYAAKLGAALAEKFRGAEATVVVGPALGGIVIAYEVARWLGVRALFTERVEGAMVLRRGFALTKNDRALVIEDVVTTGGSTQEVIDVLTSSGATIVGVGAVVDRSNQSAKFSADFQSLLSMEIPAYSPDACPLCKKKIPFVKPGSRSSKP